MKRIVVLTVASWVAVAGAATDPGPIANLTEKWVNANAWQSKAINTGDPVWSWNSNALAVGVIYPSKTQSALTAPPPAGVASKLFALDATAAGRFIGDYASNGIFQVSFDVLGGQLSGGVYFYFTSSTGHQWIRPLTLPPATGTWQGMTVPLAFSPEWTVPGETPTASMMQADLAGVIQIGVKVYRNGYAAESLSIDNFKLTGPWNGTFSDGLIADSWRSEHPLPTGKDLWDQDADGDGFNNYGEFMAGTDPNDSKSRFQVEISRNAAGQTVVSWKHEYDRVFSLVKTTDLVGENGVQATAATVPSVAPKNEVVVDEPGAGPYFYKVEIEK